MFHNAKIIGVLLVVIALTGVTVMTIAHGARTDVTRVVFLDVGQGDAILISRGAHQILIDGGASSKVLMEQLSRYMPFWDRTIDVMLATHPDNDHIGAQIGVLTTYRVPIVITTGAFKNSRTATAWHSALTRARSQVVIANAATVVRMAQNNDAAGVLRVVYPQSSADVIGVDANDTSIVARLEIYGTSFLLMGDLSSAFEELISVHDADVDILKVGHHGSHFSTAEFFLDRVTPAQAVISAGRNNSYGHPTTEVLDRLRAHNATILRTDESGSIEYICRDNAGCQLVEVI